ncbi:MAG: M48 family metalloprotease [Myxococcales bacterium]|nr:M48 family metalloprotease [Myxococcales bacterium]
MEGAAEPWPRGPDEVAPGLTDPSHAYLRSAWGAAVGLGALLALYFGMTGWLGWLVYARSLALYEGTGDTVVDVVVLVPAALLFVVLMKGLFFVRRSETSGFTEISAEDEPRLFAFIHRVAEEAGAQPPHRVFLSPRVNAAVFYDLAWWNLLFPTRKNLEIGLGVVNAVSLDEFKAVLSHEFGHFAQRAMRVGAWVYLTQQFVGDLIGRRDGIDRFLDGLCRSHPVIAWAGWILRLLVWATRSVLESAFRFVIRMERALSREMEFQADRVAVSLTGSDSLVHALHRLGAADVAWDLAMQFSIGQLQEGTRPRDLFSLQTDVLDGMRRLLHDPTHGRTPPLPADGRASHRVFRPGIADAPRMWSSHPPNHEREHSAKATYLPSNLDERAAWVLFEDSAGRREAVTSDLFEMLLEAELPPVGEDDVVHAALRTQFTRPHQQPRYRGAWFGREVTRHAADARELLDAEIEAGRSVVIEALDRLYPPTLRQLMERLGELGTEKAALEGLAEGFLEAPGGVIRFRGREVHRRELRGLIAEVGADLVHSEAQLQAHDRQVRTAHCAAARLVGNGWESYLRALIRMLHFAEHSAADAIDALDHLNNRVMASLADRNVSRRERRLILQAALQVHETNHGVYGRSAGVRLNAELAEALKTESFAALYEEAYSLPPPSPEYLAEWLETVQGWTQAGVGPLRALAGKALDALVDAEAHVERCLREGTEPGPAPEPPTVPRTYPRLVQGQERPRVERLTWWDRFVMADGVVAGTARLLVALAILLPAIYLSTMGSSVGMMEELEGLGQWIERWMAP